MRTFRRIASIMVGIVLVLLGGFIFLNEPLPMGDEGERAEQLADKMLNAVNYDAWEQTGAIQWNFGGRHQHVWDKVRHLAQISWDDKIIQIDINQRVGLVKSGPRDISESEQSELCYQAWSYWANDSFWLNPVAKIRDSGTTRYIVNIDDADALLVSHNQGGVTPGDSYLWFPDENGLPYRWKMWVSIIPVGGVSTSWEDWIKLSTGAMVSTSHTNIFTLRLTEISAAESLIALRGEDIFEDLIEGENLISF